MLDPPFSGKLLRSAMLRLTAMHPPPLRPPHSVPRAESVAGGAPRRRRAARKAGQALRRPMSW